MHTVYVIHQPVKPFKALHVNDVKPQKYMKYFNVKLNI